MEGSKEDELICAVVSLPLLPWGNSEALVASILGPFETPSPRGTPSWLSWDSSATSSCLPSSRSLSFPMGPRPPWVAALTWDSGEEVWVSDVLPHGPDRVPTGWPQAGSWEPRHPHGPW